MKLVNYTVLVNEYHITMPNDCTNLAMMRDVGLYGSWFTQHVCPNLTDTAAEKGLYQADRHESREGGERRKRRSPV